METSGTPLTVAADLPLPVRSHPVAAPAAFRSTAPVSIGKRLFDVVASVSLVVLLVPLLLLIAVTIKLSSTGPVLFRQRRVGHGGAEFFIWKFRTMHAGAEERLDDEDDLSQLYLAEDHKVPGHLDPRITRFGRWLRKTSIDELPQLVNVLVGEMSMVGPRPVRATELECYGDLLPMYLSVRPGMTGLWQVSGRSEVKFPARAEIDARYASSRNFWLDLRILVRTPWAVVAGRGAG